MKHDDLWSFALACYAQPGVEKACLDLQSAGVDVCLLLACAWLECRRTAYEDARLKQLQTISDDWRTLAVVPLRNLRGAWRQPAEEDDRLAELRARVKALELDAEHVQLMRLQLVAKHWPSGDESASWMERVCSDIGADALMPIEKMRHAASAQFEEGGN